MITYLGEFELDIEQSNAYANYSTIDWLMTFVEKYGQLDGSHHKQWVLDQIARISKGTPVIVKVAKWSDGTQEIRFWTDNPSKEYLDWVLEMKGNFNPETKTFDYSYNEGISP